MDLQRESFFLREVTQGWQTCLATVPHRAVPGQGSWTMAALPPLQKGQPESHKSIQKKPKGSIFS